MIGRLRGVLAEVGEEDLLIDVGGVGYVVRCGARTLARLPAVGDEALLHIESQTREDGVRLYGFLTREERRAFVLLQAIQGVGPKAAQAVLDVLPPGVPTLAVEAGVRFGWERYADDVVSIDRFGASAPGEVVMRELGITPEHTVERALALLDTVGGGGS